jgi:thioredoxin-like negative regulator of GroEL
MESPLAHLQRKERDRLRIARVDIDARPEMADRFRVTTVPTLVLLDSGREIARHEGRASLPTIERLLAPHLGPDTGSSETAAAIA